MRNETTPLARIGRFGKDPPVTQPPGRREPAGRLIKNALRQKGLPIRTLARMRVDELHPDLTPKERNQKIANLRRQIRKWISKESGPTEVPVNWLGPESAEWVSRLLGIPQSLLLKPPPDPVDQAQAKIRQLESSLAQARAELLALRDSTGSRTEPS